MDSSNKAEATENKKERIENERREQFQQILSSLTPQNKADGYSSGVYNPELIQSIYEENDYKLLWRNDSVFIPVKDSATYMIDNAAYWGLFSNLYHKDSLHKLIKKIDSDTAKTLNYTYYQRADILLTDAMLHIFKDLKYGRLKPDSTTLNADTIPDNAMLVAQLKKVLKTGQLSTAAQSLQPSHKGYWQLLSGIKKFVDGMNTKKYTYINYTSKFKDSTDSIRYIMVVKKRLSESDCIEDDTAVPDSSELYAAVRKFQALKGVKPDGKLTMSLVKLLNNTDVEKFKRIAITLDRYKMLPQQMPERYIWVNLPGYYLQVWAEDTITFESRVICGKPVTRTPLLTSYITDMVTYPTWTVPNSIIVKQYLPKLKDNPNYLKKIGLNLLNAKGEHIDPATITWSKYSKGIPYKVMQNSGDNNALGVFKFNFNNPFFVYLHDTNERYLFKNVSRAYSHGCVRVQEWEKLAAFIAQTDSILAKPGETISYNADSIKSWIAAKQKRRIDVVNKIPLFIRYFTCDVKEGNIVFYDDIYGEDAVLRNKYFND